MLARSIPLREIGIILLSKLGMCNQVQLGVYSMASWECAIECNPEITPVH